MNRWTGCRSAVRWVVRSIRSDRSGDHAFDILDAVPPGQDVLRRRLSGEPIWLELQNHARMRIIRGKQGLGNLTYQ